MAAKVQTKRKTIEVPSVAQWLSSTPSTKPAGYMTLRELAAAVGVTLKTLDYRLKASQCRCESEGVAGPHDMRVRYRVGGRMTWCYPCPEMEGK